jgi:glycosyltransferase involved in cell wall biosynthesis
MGSALMAKGMPLDIIGGDDLDCPEWQGIPHVRFLNLRGNLSEQASLLRKVIRILDYYARLLHYAFTSRADVFHILWNNKFDAFDRVPLMLYYKTLGKKTVLTVHNVNAGMRDSNDTWFNRLTLKIQYNLTDHLFVHTEQMKKELEEEFGVTPLKISVVPFGINNAVPNTNLSCVDARLRLGVAENDRLILFFGYIAPYKGLEFLVDAFRLVAAREPAIKLIIAGNWKNSEGYWQSILKKIAQDGTGNRILLKVGYIPDEETEVYFKAADALVLPYRHIYQSGVLFLGQSFGLPVVATDVGAMRDEVIEGKTGFLCRPDDTIDLARVICRYFSSQLYLNLGHHRHEIQKYARERHSWDVVGEITANVYGALCGPLCLKNSCRVPQVHSEKPTEGGTRL